MTTTWQSAVVGAVSELRDFITEQMTTEQTEIGQSAATNLFQTVES